jgi:hypothetical protein
MARTVVARIRNFTTIATFVVRPVIELRRLFHSERGWWLIDFLTLFPLASISWKAASQRKRHKLAFLLFSPEWTTATKWLTLRTTVGGYSSVRIGALLAPGFWNTTHARETG